MIKSSMVALVSAVVLFSSASDCAADNLAERLTVTQWVQPEARGVFEARVVIPRANGQASVVSGASVRLFGASNRIRRGVTDKNGDVTIRGVDPGVYTLTVQAGGMVGWQAMHIVGPNQAVKGQISSRATISPALIDVKEFKEIVEPFKNQYYTLDDVSMSDVDVVKLVDQIGRAKNSQVMMTAGGMVGTICAATTLKRANVIDVSRLESSGDATITLFRGGSKVKQVKTDERGRFFVDSLKPGIYSIVVANREGLAAMSFELIEGRIGDNASRLTDDGKVFVMAQGGGDGFCCQVGPGGGGGGFMSFFGGPGAGGGGGAFGALGAAAAGSSSSGGGTETNTPNTAPGGN